LKDERKVVQFPFEATSYSFAIWTRFRDSVLIKQDQRFGVARQTEINATFNFFVSLICINAQPPTHRHNSFIERYPESYAIRV